MVKKYNQQIIEYSKKKWGGDYDPANISISNMVFRENGLGTEAAYAMEKWIAEQDSLRNWRISSGSSSPKVQWVIAKYYGRNEEASIFEKEISENPAETRFRLLLKTIDMYVKEK